MAVSADLYASIASSLIFVVDLCGPGCILDAYRMTLRYNLSDRSENTIFYLAYIQLVVQYSPGNV